MRKDGSLFDLPSTCDCVVQNTVGMDTSPIRWEDATASARTASDSRSLPDWHGRCVDSIWARLRLGESVPVPDEYHALERRYDELVRSMEISPGMLENIHAVGKNQEEMASLAESLNKFPLWVWRQLFAEPVRMLYTSTHAQELVTFYNDISELDTEEERNGAAESYELSNMNQALLSLVPDVLSRLVRWERVMAGTLETMLRPHLSPVEWTDVVNAVDAERAPGSGALLGDAFARVRALGNCLRSKFGKAESIHEFDILRIFLVTELEHALREYWKGRRETLLAEIRALREDPSSSSGGEAHSGAGEDEGDAKPSTAPLETYFEAVDERMETTLVPPGVSMEEFLFYVEILGKRTAIRKLVEREDLPDVATMLSTPDVEIPDLPKDDLRFRQVVDWAMTAISFLNSAQKVWPRTVLLCEWADALTALVERGVNTDTPDAPEAVHARRELSEIVIRYYSTMNPYFGSISEYQDDWIAETDDIPEFAALRVRSKWQNKYLSGQVKVKCMEFAHSLNMLSNSFFMYLVIPSGSFSTIMDMLREVQEETSKGKGAISQGALLDKLFSKSQDVLQSFSLTDLLSLEHAVENPEMRRALTKSFKMYAKHALGKKMSSALPGMGMIERMLNNML